MSQAQSTPNGLSAETNTPVNTKQKLKEDTLALATLIYDVFKEERINGNVEHDLKNERKVSEVEAL